MSDARVPVSRRIVLVGLGLGASATVVWFLRGDPERPSSELAVTLEATTPTYTAFPAARGDLVLSVSGLRANLTHEIPDGSVVALRSSDSAKLEFANGTSATGEADHPGAWLGPIGEGRVSTSIGYQFRTGVPGDPGSLQKLEWLIEGEVRRGDDRQHFSLPAAVILRPDRGVGGTARRTGAWTYS